jgi:hypothetical protein
MEMLHLTDAIWVVVRTIEVPDGRVDLGRITVAVCSTAKIKAGNIDSEVLRLASASSTIASCLRRWLRARCR